MREYPRKDGRPIPSRITALEIEQIFNEELDVDHPKPPRAEYGCFAKKIVVITETPDSWREQSKQLQEILDLSSELRQKLEKFAPDGKAPPVAYGYPIAELYEVLAEMATGPVNRKASPGHPVERWHRAGHEIAKQIQCMLRKEGHQKRLGKTDRESLTARIGAAIVSRVFGLTIAPTGFADAMRGRNRSKAARKSFDEHFAGAARIQ